MNRKQLAAHAERHQRDWFAKGYINEDFIVNSVTAALVVYDGCDETTARKAAQAAWDNATAKPPV